MPDGSVSANREKLAKQTVARIKIQYSLNIRYVCAALSLSPCTKCTFADFFVHFFFFSIYFIFMALSFVAHSTDTLYRFIYTTKHLDVCILFSFQRFINQSKLKANGL